MEVSGYRSHLAPLFAGAIIGTGVILWHLRSSPTKHSTDSFSSLCSRNSGYGGMIGNTPLVKLDSLSKLTGRDIFVKCEYLNPGGTAKDRIALAMIEDAEKSGILTKNGTVVEGTSGSTGIALAAVCASKGYKCICVLPDDQAKEKSDLLKMYGAEVHIVKTASIASPQHYVNYARKLASEIEGGVFMDQFENQANFNIHYNRTGPEIWHQMNHNIDAFVMSAGTGGTIAGVSQYLKLKTKNSVKVVLADPFGSSLLNYVLHGVCWAKQQSERRVRRHRYDSLVEGIGLDRVTKNMSQGSIDHGFCISDQDALHVAHFLVKHEGLIIGSSSAMNIAATVLYAKQLAPGSRIVTVLCDSGQRHMTRFWNPGFVEGERQLHWPTPREAEEAMEDMALRREK